MATESRLQVEVRNCQVDCVYFNLILADYLEGHFSSVNFYFFWDAKRKHL